MEWIMSRPHFLFPALIVFGAVALPLALSAANAFQFDHRLTGDDLMSASAVVPVASTTPKKKATARAKINLHADQSVPEYAVGATGGYNPCPQCPYGCSWNTPKVCWK
jgi:hypothetical protein